MTRHPASPWTEALDADLRRMWAAGWPTAQISTAMQLTRNQVLGRVQRLKLVKRGSPVGGGKTGQAARPQVAGSSTASMTLEQGRQRDRRETEKLQPHLDQPLRIDAVFASEAPDHQQPRGCRHITGSGTAWRFCQAATALGDPYCTEHAVRCYRRPGDPQEE